jgi:hypothetical protein
VDGGDGGIDGLRGGRVVEDEFRAGGAPMKVSSAALAEGEGEEGCGEEGGEGEGRREADG